MNTERKRLYNLDMIKAFGILMVLSLHVPLWNVDFMETRSISRVVQYAFRLISEGVPLFVMVNGFLLFRKRSFDFKNHMLKTLRMIVLFFVWCVILTLAGMAIDMDSEPITFYNVFKYVISTQVGSKYTGVLWFLQSLTALYLVFPILRYMYDEHFGLFKYTFAVFACFTVGISVIEMARDYLGSFRDVNVFSDCIGFFYCFDPTGNRWYVFYFMLGGMMNYYHKKIQEKRLLLSVVGLVSWLLAFVFGYTLSLRYGWVYNPAFNYGSVFMAFSLVGMYAITLPYENKGKLYQKIIASVGQNTFGIYLVHYVFIFIVHRFFILDTWLMRSAAFVIIFIASHIFSLLLRRIPGAKQLFNIG